MLRPPADGDLPPDIEGHLAIYAREHGLNDDSPGWLLDLHAKRFLGEITFLPSETLMEDNVRSFLEAAIH